LIAFMLLSQFMAYFQQGADPASIFRGHSLYVPEEDQAIWQRISGAEGKTPSHPQTEEMIAAYWLAWEAIVSAHRTSDPADLLTYWAGSAYDQVLEGMALESHRITGHGEHHLRLTYFSVDGRVAGFEDTDFLLQQTINGTELELRVNATVVMTLDQGFWRIRLLTLSYDSS